MNHSVQNLMTFNYSRNYVSCVAHRSIHPDTETSLRKLEDDGFDVSRYYGSPWVDVARSVEATHAMESGYESILFVDSDMLFHSDDAATLCRRDFPVIGGVYSCRTVGEQRQLNVHFHESAEEVLLGEDAPHPYPVDLIATGFLRISCNALRTLKESLKLPKVVMGRNKAYPFFMPVIASVNDEPTYLPEDYAFCFRCLQAGIRPFADTTLRIGHIGDYAYHLEEGLGGKVARQKTIVYRKKPE